MNRPGAASVALEAPAPTDGLPMPRRLWSVVAISTYILMSVLDASMLAVALPGIARDLGVPPSEVTWLVGAYQAAAIAFLLPVAALAERVGLRRVFICGLFIFMSAALACVFSPTFTILVAARALQGIGASCVNGTSVALIRATYPKRMLGQGLGLGGMMFAVASAVGPVISSVLLTYADWRWLFAIDAPLGLMAAAIGLKALPTPPTSHRPYDWRTAALLAVATLLLFGGLQAAGHQPSAPAGVAVAVGLCLGVLLLRSQMRTYRPLFPIDLFRRPAFALSAGTAVAAQMVNLLTLISLPFFMQARLGLTQLQVGALMTPWALAVAVVAPVAGWLSDRVSPPLLAGAGLLWFGGALGLLISVADGASLPTVGALIAGCGGGFAFFQSPNGRMLMTSAPRRRSGAAGGVLAISRLAGYSLAAVLAAVFLRQGAAHGSSAAIAFACMCAPLAAGISFLRLWSRRSASGAS